MPDPAETPAQALERLNKEIADLRRLRAQLPMMILRPYVEDAMGHIKEVAARLTVQAKIPASEAITALRTEQTETTTPEAPPTVPPELPTPGTPVTVTATGTKSIAVLVRRLGFYASPEKWEVLVLTEDGRVLALPPEELSPTAAAGPAPTSKPSTARGPGSRVRDRTTGATGYVSEVAGDKATVALDAGGFIVRALVDLEPV